MKQFYFIFFIISTVYGSFCDENIVGVTNGVSEAGEQALSQFNEDICSGDSNAAAYSLFQSMSSGSEEDSAATAKAFSEAAEYDVSLASDALALVLRDKNFIEVNAIFQTIRQSYKNMEKCAAYDAAVNGYAKAIDNGDISARSILYGKLDEVMDVGRQGFDMAVVHQAVKLNCQNLKLLLTDIWAVLQQIPEEVMFMSKNFEIIIDLAQQISNSYECLQGCCE